VSTFDYDRILRGAKERVTKFGRSITFVQLNPGPDNAAQPWKGTADVRSEVIDSLTVDGVFVEPESLERLGKAAVPNEFVKSSEQVIITATEFSLEHYDEVIDSVDGARYKIANLQQLNPGDTIVLHYVRVQRRGRTTAVRGALL
jgi:hypothetical protein